MKAEREWSGGLNRRPARPIEIARTIAAIPERLDGALPAPVLERFPRVGPTEIVVVTWPGERRSVLVGYPRIGARAVVMRRTHFADGTVMTDEQEVNPWVRGRSLRALVDAAIDWLLEDVVSNVPRTDDL